MSELVNLEITFHSEPWQGPRTLLDTLHIRLCELHKALKERKIKVHEGTKHEGWELFYFYGRYIWLNGELSGFPIKVEVVTENGYRLGQLPEKDEKLTAILVELFSKKVHFLEEMLRDPDQFGTFYPNA